MLGPAIGGVATSPSTNFVRIWPFWPIFYSPSPTDSLPISLFFMILQITLCLISFVFACDFIDLSLSDQFDPFRRYAKESQDVPCQLPPLPALAVLRTDLRPPSVDPSGQICRRRHGHAHVPVVFHHCQVGDGPISPFDKGKIRKFLDNFPSFCSSSFSFWSRKASESSGIPLKGINPFRVHHHPGPDIDLFQCEVGPVHLHLPDAPSGHAHLGDGGPCIYTLYLFPIPIPSLPNFGCSIRPK